MVPSAPCRDLKVTSLLGFTASPKTLRVFVTSAGNFSFPVRSTFRASRIPLQMLSTNSFALPIARAGSFTMLSCIRVI